MGLPSAHLAALLILCAVHLISAGTAKNFDSHPCARECKAETKPMVCDYEMYIETYASMSKACYRCPFNVTDCYREHCVIADGFRRLIYTINRQLPSPQIRVCEGDKINVEVKNHMNNGEGTSIHWHGIHQVDSAYMDGVSMITQCPILPFTEFHYSFKASPHGTHFYHSHVGTQRGEGLAGALIVRPLMDTHSTLYNNDLPEHTMVIQDWFTIIGGAKAMLHLHARDNNRPDSIIINGMAPGNVSSDDGSTFGQVPHNIFKVKSGETYRFRVISNALMNCPIEMYVEDHSLLTIASDGADIEPVAADVIVISGGERYDFVLTANASVGNYWMYFRGLTDCSQRKTQTLAVLRYEGAADAVPTTTPNGYDERPTDVFTLNPFNMGLVDHDPADKHLTLNKLRSAEAAPDWLKEEPTIKALLHLGLHRTDNPLFNVPGLYGWMDDIVNLPGGGTVLAQINGVNGMMPGWPYLSQYEDIPESQFCDVDSPSINETYCTENFCQCIHRLKVELGEVVELIMIDRGKHWNISNHPMHIHGNFLHVLGMMQGKSLTITKQEVIDMDVNGKIPRNTDRPIKKDTIMMPNGGFVVTRFKAENPGVWFLHCHNEVHVEQGMSMVIEVGDAKKWPQNPHPAYKCGSVKASEPKTRDPAPSRAASGTGLRIGLSSMMFLLYVVLSISN